VSKFKLNKAINSANYKIVHANFQILVDTDSKPPVIGLMVEPVHGKTFIMPMPVDCARAISESMLRTLLKVSPEIFADIARH
jgi:hypothetical protein